jgi:hypothetical protein
MAQAGVAGRPVASQSEVEVAHMRDEEPVALIGEDQERPSGRWMTAPQ